MALKLKESDAEDKAKKRSAKPTIPAAALEEHRRSPAVAERRERVQARLRSKS